MYTRSLLENGLEHSASLSGAVTALRQDEQKRISDIIDRVKLEENVMHGMQIIQLCSDYFFSIGEALYGD